MSSVVFFLLAVGFVIIIAVGFLTLVSWRGTRSAVDAANHRDAEQYAAREDVASARLLEADEVVRSTVDEADFASAQFGIARTEPLRQAIERAREGVTHAFEIQHALSQQDNPRERARMADEIISTLDTVMPPLLAAHAEFAHARNEQADADRQIRHTRALLEETRDKLAAVDAELDALASIHPASALTSLMDNPTQARGLLDSATHLLDTATNALDNDRAAAVRHLDNARRALAMASHQIDAVMGARDDLAAADERLTSAIASITADISDVSTLKADPTAFAPLVEDANTAVRDARAARNGQADPLAALEALRMAEDALDAALAPLRGHSQARAKQAASAARHIQDAEIAVARAQSFVQARRGLIPLEGRSLLTSAEGHLVRARSLASREPADAIVAAETAKSLATEVLSTSIPLNEYDQFEGGNPRDYMPSGIAGRAGHYRGGNGGAGLSGVGAAVGGAVLGAVLGSALGKGGSLGNVFDLASSSWAKDFDFDFDFDVD